MQRHNRTGRETRYCVWKRFDVCRVVLNVIRLLNNIRVRGCVDLTYSPPYFSTGFSSSDPFENITNPLAKSEQKTVTALGPTHFQSEGKSIKIRTGCIEIILDSSYCRKFDVILYSSSMSARAKMSSCSKFSETKKINIGYSDYQ
jgi:hypothetical protein